MRNLAACLACILAGCGGCDDSFDPVDGACGSVETPEAPEPVAAECFDTGDGECPAEAPSEGLSCGPEGSECSYGEYDGFACTRGRWTHSGEGWEGDAPPLTEMCLEPFDGTVAGAQILLGPPSSGPFRPFTDCEDRNLEWGPQGGAMLPFALRVVGDDLPECVVVETRLGVGTHEFDATGGRVALHCGQSLLVYAVIPWDLQSALCNAPDTVVMKLTVDVQGVGSTFARVRVPSPGACGDPDLG